MAAKTDFLLFYQRLGLPANCSVDDLKSAYRRRVAALHPDRQLNRETSRADTSRLQELTAAYDAVMSFQRNYGRLPGTSQAATKRGNHAIWTPRNPPAKPSIDAPPFRLGRPLFLVGLLLVLVWILLGSNSLLGIAQRGNDAPPLKLESEVIAREGAPVNAYIAPRPSQIVIGMDKHTVRSIEGAPLMAASGHWDYGPSWIDFNDTGVSDWYSSRLRPLRVASQHAPAGGRLADQGPPYD